MKKTLIFGLIVAIGLSTAIAQAQTVTTSLTANAASAVSAPTLAVEAPLTLTERKTKAETDLRALETQFRLFTTRTQLTIDRLGTKGVDTEAAQTELTSAITSLNTAKANLDLFAKIVVTDDMNEEAIEKTGLKASLTKIQDNLKEARTHLIQSLTTLKATVTLTQ
jgi:hypothetical protein